MGPSVKFVSPKRGLFSRKKEDIFFPKKILYWWGGITKGHWGPTGILPFHKNTFYFIPD